MLSLLNEILTTNNIFCKSAEDSRVKYDAEVDLWIDIEFIVEEQPWNMRSYAPL
jgi:hypothetical protein